jgi:hypothetical protein
MLALDRGPRDARGLEPAVVFAVPSITVSAVSPWRRAIAPRVSLALIRFRPGAAQRIAPIDFDLSKKRSLACRLWRLGAFLGAHMIDARCRCRFRFLDHAHAEKGFDPSTAGAGESGPLP